MLRKLRAERNLIGETTKNQSRRKQGSWRRFLLVTCQAELRRERTPVLRHRYSKHQQIHLRLSNKGFKTLQSSRAFSKTSQERQRHRSLLRLPLRILLRLNL